MHHMRFTKVPIFAVAVASAVLIMVAMVVSPQERVDSRVLESAAKAAIERWRAQTYSWDVRTRTLTINTIAEESFQGTLDEVCGNLAIREQLNLGAKIEIHWFRGLKDTEAGLKPDTVTQICEHEHG